MRKLRFWDRVLSAVMGIVCIAVAAAMVLYVFGVLPVQQIKDALFGLTVGGWQRWLILGAAVLLLVLLGLHGVGMLFRRRKDKGFVIQHTEYGDMSISMKAMENMVKKCVDAHSELTVNHTKIYLVRGGVSMDMKITLASGVNIPLTVNALQKQIKQYITSCSGVDVHEVRVKVETDTVRLLPPPQSPVIEPAPAEEFKRVENPAEHLYQHKEEPHHYADSPVQEPVAEVLEETPEEIIEDSICAEAAQEAVVEAEEQVEDMIVEAAEENPAVAEEASADA